MLATPSADLIARRGGPSPRYTSYPAATEWSAAVGAKEAEHALARANRSRAPLGLYIHLPFCVEMCRFCGCNVIATRDQSRADAYLDVLEREIALWKRHLPDRSRVSQLHLGGGTPTFLSVAQLERLMSLLAPFELLPDAELAVEVDPEVTTDDQLRLLAEAGFSRISLGIQDLDPRVQRAIGRLQDEARTREIVTTARTLGFRSVNLDLMYGLPFQTPATLERTLESVLEMRPDRLALFGYAHVPWAKPHQRLLPQAHLPGPVDRVELFVTASNRLQEAGFVQIGLDHFARETDELALALERGSLSRNFQGYTSGATTDTIAFGMSGISDVAGAYLQNAHRLSTWEEQVRAGILPVERGLRRTADDDLRASAISSIMCRFELDFEGLRREFGEAALELQRSTAAALASCAADGLVELSGERIRVLPTGRIFLRNVAMIFDAYVPSRVGLQTFSRAV